MAGLGNNGGMEQGRKFEIGGPATMLLDVDAAIDGGDTPLAQVTGGVIHDAETGAVREVKGGVDVAWDEGELREELLSKGRRMAQAMRRGRKIRAKRGDSPPIEAVSEADFATMPPRNTRPRRDFAPQPAFEAAA